MHLPGVLAVVISMVVFTLASLIYWRLVRFLVFLVQLGAFVAGAAIVLHYNGDDELLKGLGYGSFVYLAILTLVLAWIRIIILEKELIRLGGKPNTPDFAEFLFNRLVHRSKPKNQEGPVPSITDQIK